MYNAMNHKGNWLGTHTFWMNKDKITRAGFEPATPLASELTCRCSTNWAELTSPILAVSPFCQYLCLWAVSQKSLNHILPFSQGSRPNYDTTWEEAVRGCTIKGYDFFSPPTTRMLVSQFPPAHLNELILHSWDDPPAVYLSSSIFQSPAFSWGRSELTDRNVELYPQLFLELITTQLRFYMVSPQLVLLIILTMQSFTY